MRRADRLFEIIQILRSARRPTTAGRLAEQLEVSQRTIYRDLASLQAMRVPIEGEAGVGYIMRRGYDLPPLMFTAEECEAMAVGLSLVSRTGDRALERAAGRAARKVEAALQGTAGPLDDGRLRVSTRSTVPPASVDMEAVRRAMREEHKLAIEYRDEQGRETARTVLPIALVYYADATVLAAWCELRSAFRHFRADRMSDCKVLEATFKGEGKPLREAWTADTGLRSWAG